MAAWTFEGVDVEAAQKGCYDMTAAAFDGLLRGLCAETPVVWTRTDRRPVGKIPPTEFSDRIAAGIDKVWREVISADSNPLFQNNHHIAVAMPVAGSAVSLAEITRGNIDAGQSTPTAFLNALRGKFAGNQKRIGFSTREELDVVLKRFSATICAPIENRDTGVSVWRLKGDALLGFLKSTASTSAAHPVAVDHFEYLDTYLSDTSVDNRFSDALVLSGASRKYAATFSLKKAPHAYASGAFNSLLSLPVSISISSCWRVSPKAESESFLQGVRSFDELRSLEFKKVFRSMMNPQGVLDGDDAPKTEVGQIAMSLKHEVQQDRAYCGWLATTVTVYADTETDLRLSCDLVGRTLERAGMVFLREREGNLAAFCVGIPGQLTEPVRWHFVEAGNVTDMTPLTFFPAGAEYHPCIGDGKQLPNAVFRTRQGTRFNFNYYTGQLGHSLLIGPSRNGKTMLQMFLSAQFLKYRNARIFVLDKDLSCKPQTLLMGGVHMNLNPNAGGLRLNPVSVATDASGRSWLLGWLDRLMTARGQSMSDADLREVSDAIRSIADMPGARLTTLASQLPSRLRDRLAPWCEGGAWGAYFDNDADEFGMTHFTTVEVGVLLSMGLANVVTAFAEYAFYRIEQSLTGRTQAELGPTMIYFEEAGFLLDDETFANKARDYLMTLAKKGAFLVMTAQSPEPFINHPKLGAAVRDNVATVIFMPNRQAQQPNLGEKYIKAFGVNENHLDLIAEMIPREEYGVFQPQTGIFRVIQAKFPPSIVAALRSDAASQAALLKTFRDGDDSWKANYLDAMA